MSRILHHVGRKEFKKVHQRKLDEQNLLWQEEQKKYSTIQEIKRISERFKSDWRTELAEAMSSKDFPYIYGGVVTVDILSLTNLPGSQFAQNSIQSGAKQTDYSFGSEFPGSYVNSIGDIPNVVASAVDSWDSVNDLAPSGWEPLNSDEYQDNEDGDFTGVVSFGQETAEFKDTHFGEVHLSGDRITIHTGDDGDPNNVSEPGDSTVDIEDLQTLFPGITFPQSLPSPNGDELEPMDPIQASMILRTFKDARVGDKLSFNYSFDTLETEEDDVVTYRGGQLFPTGEDAFVDDYAFVIVGDSIKGKIVSVLARDGNNIDFNFNDDSGNFKPDVLQGRFPLTGKYEYTVTKDDIDDYGNVKFFIGVMDVESGIYQSTLDITSLKNDTREAAGKLGKVTGGYDLGAPVSALDPGHRERRGIERKDIRIDRINVEINNIQIQINNLRAKEQALLDAYTNRESYMDKYLRIQEKWAKIIDPLQYELQTKYIGQMAPKGLVDKINSLISQQDAELEAMRKDYDSETSKFESKILDLQNQQAQKQNELQTLNVGLISRGFRSATDPIRYSGSTMFQGNPAGRSPGLSNYWSPDPVTAGTYSNPGAGRGVPGARPNPTGTITSARRPPGTPRVSRSPLGQPQFKFPKGTPPPSNMLTQMADDAAVVAGRKAAATTAGRTLGRVVPGIAISIAAADAAIRASNGDYAGAVLSGISAVPGPIGWAALGLQLASDAVGVTGVREQKEFANYDEYLRHSRELVKKNNIKLDRNAMLAVMLREIAKSEKLTEEDKTFLVAIFTNAEGLTPKDVVSFVKKIQKKLMGEVVSDKTNNSNELYPGQPSPNGFPDNPPAQLAPNGYHPEFGKRSDRYRRLDPISAKTMARVMTGDPETDSQVAAAARQPKVAPQKSTTWRRAKKHLRRA